MKEGKHTFHKIAASYRHIPEKVVNTCNPRLRSKTLSQRGLTASHYG